MKFISYFRLPTSHTTVRAVRHTAVSNEVYLLLSFTDLSHHRTCRSAYGGSLHSVQLNIVVHQARVASTTEFLVPSGVVHNAFRISPTSLAAIPVDSSPVWLDTALD